MDIALDGDMRFTINVVANTPNSPNPYMYPKLILPARSNSIASSIAKAIGPAISESSIKLASIADLAYLTGKMTARDLVWIWEMLIPSSSRRGGSSAKSSGLYM